MHQLHPNDQRLLAAIQTAVKNDAATSALPLQRWLWAAFILYAGLSVALYSALFWVKSPWLFALVFVGYGYSTLLLAFNFAHDLAHGTVFRQNTANHWGFVALYTLVGAHAEAWKIRHIQAHHLAPNVQEYDPDIQMTSLIRLSPDAPRRWFHRYQHWYGPLAYTIYSLYWIFIKDFALFFTHKDARLTPYKTTAYKISFWAQKTIYFTYLLVIPLLFSGQPWWVVVAAFLAMHLLMSLFLLFTFLMTHHVEGTLYPEVDSNGQIHTSWVMNQIGSSNDMHPFSRGVNFLLGGFNNHTAHHLFPAVHHFYYPRMSRVLYRVLAENGIRANSTTYWGGVVSHWRLLRRMGSG